MLEGGADIRYVQSCSVTLSLSITSALHAVTSSGEVVMTGHTGRDRITSGYRC